MAQKTYLDKPGLQEVLLKIKEKFAPIEALIFKGTVADIAHLPALADQKAGWMYNVTKGGPTGAGSATYEPATIYSPADLGWWSYTGNATKPSELYKIPSDERSYEIVDSSGNIRTFCQAPSLSLVASPSNPQAEGLYKNVGSSGEEDYVEADETTPAAGVDYYSLDTSVTPINTSGKILEGDYGLKTEVADAYNLYVADGSGGYERLIFSAAGVTTIDATATYYLKVNTSDFVEGADKMLRDGDNVAAVNVGTEEDPVYKWDIISGVFKIEDRLQFGFEMPADPEDEQVFLYLGETTYAYPAVSPAPTPDSDPATLGLFEKDATLDKYTESADDHLVTGKTYFTISADASTPPTSDPADEGYYELDTTGGVNTYTKTTDTSVDSGKTYYILTIAEATVTRGDDPQASGWYVDDGTGNYELTTDTYVVSGTTYHTKEEEFVEGVIYQYDETASKWNSKTAGDTFTRITEAEIDAMFDNL